MEALGHTSIRLDPDFNVMFHIGEPGTIEIQVIAKTTGWVGFGFSHSESMTNMDMVIGGVNDTSDVSFYHGVSSYQFKFVTYASNSSQSVL